MVTSPMNLREEVPVNIVKWAGLENTMNELFRNFEAWEKRNAELVNRFFNQAYFMGEESLIGKLIETKPDLKFDDIEKEWINLALLLYNNWTYDLKLCLDKINNNNIKEAFIQLIHDKIQAEIWRTAPYDHFDDPNECGVTAWDTNVAWYFQKVVDYLAKKESATNWKKVKETLLKMNITNADLNALLPAWEQIPAGVELTNPGVPVNTKNAFDALLSFEIGKEADRTISIANDFLKSFQSLHTNSLPAINTVVWESDEYKYNEEKLWSEYQTELQTITANTGLSETEKNKQIEDLRWKHYIKYLKAKNSKIWTALEQLYNNDFDYSKVDPNVLKDYFDIVADIRLKMLFDKWMLQFIKLNFWNVDEFKNFYKELTNVDPANPVLNITLSDVNIPWASAPNPLTWPLNIPVHRKIVEWKNMRLKDITQFWKNADKPFDAFPMEFTIDKTDIEHLNITIEDKTKLLNLLSKYDKWDKYEIKWENIWVLIYLFFIINSKFPITEMDPEQQKKVEETFWQAKNHVNQPNNQENPDNSEWAETFTPEKFKEKIEKLWPWKFENWSEIWLPMWESELPGWWYQWMKVKISNVDMRKWTFKWTFFWWELKFGSKLEWKSQNFKMNKDFFSKLDKISKDTNKIYLQPNPDKLDFNSFRDGLENKLWTSDLSFPVEWTTWDGSKFMQKIIDENGKEKEVEVKYFWAASDDKSTYKIEYNPIRRNFTVSSSFNWNEKWKDWKSEKKRFSYKRDMDWNNFLIFFTQKWLVPQTEEESNSALIRQDNDFKAVNGWKWKLNWFSFNNIKNVFKTIKWNIKKKIDEYNKAQDEKLEDILIWDRWLYNKLAGVLGFIPSMKGWLWQLQQEYYNERDNRTWKKIEYYLKIFQSDPDFWTTFEQVPPFARILWWKSYKAFITDLAKPNASRSKDDIHKAAALLLANIEKWSSPYRWLSGEENSGLWVRVLLWDAHYEEFMRDKQKCINDLKKEPKEKDQIQDVLATCEMDYIINNINWANWKLGYFGSHEARWIPWKEGTNYIDNPSKRLLSDQFANKLKWSYKWRFNKSSVEESFGKISHNDFNLAKEDFKRLIKSSRFPWAVANLKKMFLLAKTPQQQSEYQKCFLLYMLSGVLDVNGKKDLRKQTYQWAKTMSFLPWMLAKETNHSQKVVALLDDFCESQWYWRFSESVKSYFHGWDLKNWDLKIDALIGELDSRWDINKMEDFEKYSKSVFPARKFPENSVLKKLQADVLDSGMENIDNSLLDNPVVANSWWLLSNANVVRDRMAIKDGAFDWKDPDERNNRALFWKQIAREVDNMNTSSPESVNLVLNQYFSRFGLNSEADRQKAYRRIKTAYYWKDKIWQPFKYDFNWKKQLLDMWTISWEEIKDILRYTFQWTVRKDCFSSRKLPPEMENALKKFQNFFEEAFNKWTLNNPIVIKNAFKSDWINTEPMLLWSRNVYKDVFAGDWEYEYDNTEIWDETDAFSRDPKKKRKAQKRAFQSWRFINYEIAQIEKSFKNRLPSGSYRPITQDTSSDIETRIKWLNDEE